LVDYISCGKDSSGFFKNGQLYTFGENMDGQLGINYTNYYNIRHATPAVFS
jgi:alpha-tubulin suppressor-like RCC1 family protein